METTPQPTQNLVVQPDRDILEAIHQITEIFKVERYIYLGACCFSLLFLLAFAAYSLLAEHEIAVVFGMFASGGAVAYTGSQILQVWKDCISLLREDIRNRTLNS